MCQPCSGHHRVCTAQKTPPRCGTLIDRPLDSANPGAVGGGYGSTEEVRACCVPQFLDLAPLLDFLRQLPSISRTP